MGVEALVIPGLVAGVSMIVVGIYVMNPGRLMIRVTASGIAVTLGSILAYTAR